jgi:precorrin-6Y C5,15-methyltransferase (decarboxylating)
VHIIAGEAPAALEDLPDPDTVFVGGSGGRLDEILEVAIDRIRAGGHIVLNVATLEHLHTAQQLAAAHDWEAEVVQLSVARGADVAGLTRLAALNPIFVVTLAPRESCVPISGSRVPSPES